MLSEHAALEDLLATLTPDQMTQPRALGGWSVKDVLAHLTEWEQMFLGWYAAGLRGEKPPTPAEGYNWGQLPALNKMIYQKHRQRSLEDVTRQFQASYRQMLELVESLPEADLFVRGLYSWMGQNNLAAFIHANGGGHYKWAREGIRKGLRARHQPGQIPRAGQER
jgi:uncharacterized protein (TIGR03083 family)